MQTKSYKAKDGTQARITEFSDLHAAFAFMKEKQNQGYFATFPERIGNRQFIVYTWRKEQ